MNEVVVHEQATLAIPQVLLNLRFAFFRALLPLLRILFVAQYFTDLFQILFGLIEQAVEADGGKVMRPGAVGAEPERNVISGLAHGAVAFVEIGAQRNVCGDGTFRFGHGSRVIAYLQRVG